VVCKWTEGRIRQVHVEHAAGNELWNEAEQGQVCTGRCADERAGRGLETLGGRRWSVARSVPASRADRNGFQAELACFGAQGSMNCKGNCWDNSVLESFFSSLKRELLDGAPFESRAVARQVIFESTLMFCNRRRRHSTLGYLTPLEFERQAQVA
jgi:transposase InsO family protein